MSINFATSCAGFIRIRLLDAEGKALEGYDSGCLFGDSIERNVQFEKPLDVLAGQTIRMEFSMKDADLYSFRFYTDTQER